MKTPPHSFRLLARALVALDSDKDNAPRITNQIERVFMGRLQQWEPRRPKLDRSQSTKRARLWSRRFALRDVLASPSN
jgi:hypothetical protein